MTELSYTAWDDNKYQWPPPEGWYQASDGKWWPEGYGPVVDQTSTDVSTASADAADTGEGAAAVAGGADDAFEATESTETESAGAGVAETGSDVGDVIDADVEPATGGADHADPVDVAVGSFEESAASDETLTEVEANGASDFTPPADSDDAVDLDTLASGFAGADESTAATESRYDSESRYSTSSAGMAASGFAPRAESGSSSLGLAGWAQPGGSSEVRNRVDVSQEYDYSPSDGEPDDLLDPIELAADDAALEASSLDPAVVDTAALDAPFDTTAGETEGFEASPIDVSAEPVDSTLSRLDDLKRQVEQQSFPTSLGAADVADSMPDLGAADVTDSMPDLGVSGFDPTETLDIDPNDLALESNPHYGGAGEPDLYGSASSVGTQEPPAADVYDSDPSAPAEPVADRGYGDRIEPESDSYGFSSVGDATIDAPVASDTRQYGFEGEPSPPMGEQPAPMTDTFGAPQVDYSSNQVLTPMSSPTPKPGPGRMVLYGVIVLLALAVAGVAGYLLFQLQSDDGDTATGDGATAPAGRDAGPSDTSLQGPGAFSDPHELAGGVRLTVPVGDDGNDEIWMLQVREPAATTDLGEDMVEVTTRLRVRNDSTSGDLSASGLRFVLVSADGSAGTTAAVSCSAGDELNLQTAIAPGNDIEGNVCWTVPAAQASGALLGVESVHAGGRVHVQLS